MSENETKDSKGKPEGATKSFVALVAAVPSLISAFTAYMAYNLDQELGYLREQRALDLQMYQAAKEALHGTPKQQLAALALIDSLGREPLKSALIRTFEVSETSDPDTTVKAVVLLGETRKENPASEPVAVKSASPTWGNWDFDLFYCSSSPENAQREAEKVAAALQGEGAQGRIRVRELATEVNQRSGYRINGYQVRRQTNEEKTGNALADFASEFLEDKGDSFVARTSTQDTPWYLSAFFCPDSKI